MKRLICLLMAALLLCTWAMAEAPVSYVPLSADEPEELRGVLPVTPADGLSLVSPACFTSDHTVPVYSLPDEDSLRAEDGKAVCVLSRVTRLFGRDGEWMLIEYAVNDEQTRVGWIHTDSEIESSLSGTVNELILAAQPAFAAQDTTLTDDPQQSEDTVLTVTAGQEVTYLTSWDGWAYVRTVNAEGAAAGGFVRAEDLTFRLHNERNDILRLLAGAWKRVSGTGWRILNFTTGGMAYDGDATLAAYCAVYDIEQGLELVLTDDHRVTTAYELTFSDESRISLTDGTKVIEYERYQQE